MGKYRTFSVMPGHVPGIHVFVSRRKKDVDGRDKPGHDDFGDQWLYLAPGSEMVPLATSLFQMNRTTSAPIVAVMSLRPDRDRNGRWPGR